MTTTSSASAERRRRTPPRTARSGCRGAAGTRPRTRPPAADWRAAASVGAHLGRVVGVVVEDPDAAARSPLNSNRRRAPVKLAEPAGSSLNGRPSASPAASAAAALSALCRPGHLQRDLAHAPAVRDELEARIRRGSSSRSLDPYVGVGRGAVGEHPQPALRRRPRERARAVVVRAGPRAPAGAIRSTNRVERRVDLLGVAVVVEVVGLDVGDDGGVGRQQQERPRRSRRPRRRRRRPVPWWALEPGSLRSPPIA